MYQQADVASRHEPDVRIILHAAHAADEDHMDALMICLAFAANTSDYLMYLVPELWKKESCYVT